MRNNDTSLRNLALNVLAKKWDTPWDSSGTVVGTAPEKVSHGHNPLGTPFPQLDHEDNQTVPLSQALGRGTRDTLYENPEKWDTPWDSARRIRERYLTAVSSQLCASAAPPISNRHAGSRRPVTASVS
jgi:hypothetical protein